MNLLPPARFRFTVEADVAAYGDGWWVYDEGELAGLPGRDLIALESALDMPLAEVMEQFRVRKMIGVMAAMWIAVHRGGHEVRWADFNPCVFLAELEYGEPAAPLGGGSGESPPTEPDSSPEPAEESATSS